MKKSTRALWIELIGFDNLQPDMGVQSLLNRTGFCPDAIVLLIWSNNFVHSYNPKEPDDTLLGWDCSAYGCRRQGMEHEIQQWSKGQLKALILNLKKNGIEVYLSFFDQVVSDAELAYFEIPEKPQLWVDKHPEVFFTTKEGVIQHDICPWKHLSDGTLYEDFFARQLIACMKEFGFDGFHGADGYAHQRLAIYLGDFSDDMVAQSRISGVKACCDNSPAELQTRASWILLNHRQEWVSFYCERYNQFWRHISADLRQNGFKLLMNSFWTRDPFESIYRYGADFSLLAEIKPDALVLEAPFADEFEPWHSTDVRSIYKYLATLLRIRCILPDACIWLMNGVRDVLEDYDPIHHFPIVLESGTEHLQHAMYFHNKQWNYSLDGMLACLSDAVTADNWKWLTEVWNFVLTKKDVFSISSAVVVWSKKMLEAELKAYIQERFASSFRLHWLLLGAGAPLNGIVSVEEASDLPPETTLVVLNSRFLSPEERSLLNKRGGKILFFDGKERAVPQLNDPAPFFTNLPEPEPSSEEIQKVARQIRESVSEAPKVIEGNCHLWLETLTDGVKLLSFFNDQPYYNRVCVEVTDGFSSVKATRNMMMPPHCEKKRLSVRMPPLGVVTVEIKS